MKTARSLSPPICLTDMDVSKLSICAPNALRLTSISIKWSGVGLLSIKEPASTIIPAHVPHVGIPAWILDVRGFLKPYKSIN